MSETFLSSALKANGMRLVDLARNAGVDKATVTRWAKKSIPAERVLEIERLTGISRHKLRPDIYPPMEAAQ